MLAATCSASSVVLCRFDTACSAPPHSMSIMQVYLACVAKDVMLDAGDLELHKFLPAAVQDGSLRA